MAVVVQWAATGPEARFAMIVPVAVTQFVLAHDVVLMAASASRAGVPSPTIAAVPRFEDGGRVLSVGVSAWLVHRFYDDLHENPQIAVSATRAPDCVSYQIKGRVLSVEPTTAADRAAWDRYVDDLMRVLWQYNPFARERGTRFDVPIDHRVRIEVTEVFVQTPGPGAGSRITT